MEEDTFFVNKVKVKISTVDNAVIGRASPVSHALLLVRKDSMYR